MNLKLAFEHISFKNIKPHHWQITREISVTNTNLGFIAFPLGVLFSTGAGLNTIVFIEEALLDWLPERPGKSFAGRFCSLCRCEDEALLEERSRSGL